MLYAFQHSGIILDEITHQPISNVELVLLNQSIKTDKKGRFDFQSNSSEVTLIKNGYQTTKIQLDENEFSIIHLTPIILVSDEIVVEESKVDKQLQFHPLKPLTLHKVHIDNSTNSTQIANKLQSVSIKSYGGPASVSTVSLHGGQGDRISIMFDGIQINSEQNGNADISQIPSALVEEIQFYPQGSSTRFGSSAITGVLNFAPPTDINKYSLSMGYFGLNQHTLLLSNTFSKLSINTAIGQHQYDGKYSYYEDGSYNQIPTEINKLHENIINNIYQQFYYLKMDYQFNSDFLTSASSMIVDNDRENSENIYLTQKTSAMKDQLKFNSFLIKWKSFEYSCTQKQNTIHFVSNFGYPTDATHNIETNTQQLKTSFEHQNISFHHNYIKSESSNAIDSSKTIASLLWEFDYSVHPFRTIISFRNDIEKNQVPVQVGEIIVEWNISKYFENLSLSISRNYKRPNFNDLYWIPFGNPNLKTEYSKNIYFRSKINLLHSCLNISLYHISYENLIRWNPKVGVMWSPENISSAKSYGYDINFDASKNPLFRFAVNISYNISKNYDNSLDLDHLGKPLMYTPKNIFSVQQSSHYKGFSVATYWKMTSERIRQYDLVDLKLPSYNTVDFSVSKIWNTKFFNYELQISIENIFDKQFQTVFGYPNPGRNITTKITIER